MLSRRFWEALAYLAVLLGGLLLIAHLSSDLVSWNDVRTDCERQLATALADPSGWLWFSVALVGATLLWYVVKALDAGAPWLIVGLLFYPLGLFFVAARHWEELRAPLALWLLANAALVTAIALA